MIRSTRGLVLLAAIIGITSCSGDPTANLRDGVSQLTATPNSILVNQGDSTQVIVSPIDGQGGEVAISGGITVTSGAGVTAHNDPTYRMTFDKNGNLTQPATQSRFRVFVRGDDMGNTSVSISGGGKSIDIPVVVLPAGASLRSATLSTTTPNVGDTVTITASAPWKFTDSSVVTVGDTSKRVQPVTLSVAADGSSAKFIVGPGYTTDTVTVSNAIVTYAAPTVPTYHLSGSALMTTPAIANLTLSKSAAAVGEIITLTAPAPYKFVATSVLTIPPLVPGVGKNVIGISADSTVMTFQSGPNANGAVSVSGMKVSGAPGLGSFTMVSGTVFTTPIVSNVAATFSNLAPNIGDTVTVTMPAGFRLLGNAGVKFGTKAAIVTSIAADSLSMKIVPQVGSTGVGNITNFAFSNLLSVALTLPSTSAALTVGTALGPPPKTGTDAIATAPAFNIPVTGATGGVIDNGPLTPTCLGKGGGDGCRIYKFTLAASRTFAVTASWDASAGASADLGVYFYTGAGVSTGNLNCDNLGHSQPEVCSQTFAAGTYLMEVDFYAYGTAAQQVPPKWIQVVIAGQ